MARDMEVRLDTRRLKRAMREHPQEVGRRVRAMALHGQSIVQMSFGTGPAGASYTRGGVTHVASVEGYPPNIDTGTLLNAITVENRGSFAQAVVAGTEYAAFLEYGTTDMGARPFMGPMVAQLAREADDFFDGLLE